MILKEMHYQREEICQTLAMGTYKEHDYVVRNYGSHPCCYVSISNGQAINVDEIICHGGITYSKDHLPHEDPIDGTWWIGWDYAHYGDYIFAGQDPKKYEKCWCSAELERDCLKVIDQLKERKDT